MRRRLLVGLVIMALVVAVGAALHWSETGQALAEPQGFASPINGGCYIAAPNVCKIHIDPFTININDGAGARLELFQLYANGSLIYDFRPDVSNPPAVDYSPSLVMQDFAARCGESYYVNMLAKDTTDANPLNYGQTAQFTCPAGVP
jgi:hypothetical protein